MYWSFLFIYLILNLNRVLKFNQLNESRKKKQFCQVLKILATRNSTERIQFPELSIHSFDSFLFEFIETNCFRGKMKKFKKLNVFC
jgi:hypothetical protein